MARTLIEYQAETGLSDEELAARLSERLDKQITVQGLKAYRGRGAPKPWAQALGLDVPGDGEAGDGETRGGPAPTAPAGTPVTSLPVPATQAHYAGERIGQVYSFIGAGIASGVGNPKVAQVFDGYSPAIGQAWVKAAEENEFARRVVNLMAAGGAMGDLVMCHVLLLGGVLYVNGRADALAGIYSRQFGPPAVVPQPQARRSANGSDPRTGDPVDGAPGSPDARVA